MKSLEEQKQYRREYYKKNKEKLLKQHKEYVNSEFVRDRHQEYQRKYREQNREKARAYGAAYREIPEHREKARQYARWYYHNVLKKYKDL